MTDNAKLPFGWSIGVLFRAWHDTVADVLDDLPHGARGFQILATVAHEEPPTQASLAAHLGIDRTVLTYVLDDLVAEGLLKRRVDSKDRRVRRLVPTTAGLKRLAHLEVTTAAAETALLGGLTEDQQSALRRHLELAATSIHGRTANHDACAAVAAILTA